MFKLFGDILLEVHETEKWMFVSCLKIIDAFCVKLMNKFSD